MDLHMTAPSLIGAPPPASAEPKSLLDLMYDGFYALFMLKNGSAPLNNTELAGKMSHFLDEFGRSARKQNIPEDDVEAAKYAFCAAVDETILRSSFSIRDAWGRQPLQLTLFGEQLAGENFYHRLEALRVGGSTHIQALEVFHMCLLLGFQGRYILEGAEKLSYFTARLGDEIAHMKGKRGGFAPHAERPDRVVNKLRTEFPLWGLAAMFTIMCAVGFLGLRRALVNTHEDRMSAYNDVVKLAPKQANLTITLP